MKLLLKKKTTRAPAVDGYSVSGAAAEVYKAEDGCCGEQLWMPAAADVVME